MEVTIRGRSIEEVEALLCEPFAENDFGSNSKNRNIEFLPVEKMEARLDAVFGKMGYDRIVSDLQVISAGATNSVILRMTCSFYDDEHNVFLTKSAHGGANLDVNDKGNAIGIKSAVSSAESDAFKRVCMSLGIGTDQLREKNFIAKDNLKDISVKIKSNWRRTNSYVKADADYKGNAVEVCIFKDSFEEFEKRCSIDQLVRECTAGKELKFKGVEGSYNGRQQVIFKSYAAKD